MKSAFSKGWDLARLRWPQPPRSRAVPHFDPPREMTELEKDSFIDGYLAWCSGRYEDKDKKR